MKLQSHISRSYESKDGRKQYLKHWIVISSKTIEKLGWKTGDDLEAEVKGNKLVIEKN